MTQIKVLLKNLIIFFMKYRIFLNAGFVSNKLSESTRTRITKLYIFWKTIFKRRRNSILTTFVANCRLSIQIIAKLIGYRHKVLPWKIFHQSKFRDFFLQSYIAMKCNFGIGRGCNKSGKRACKNPSEYCFLGQE